MNSNYIISKKYGQNSQAFDKELLKMALKDNAEPFVFIPQMIKEYGGLKVLVSDPDNAFLRESVAAALINATKLFNKQGYIVRLESAYRSISAQKALFNRRYNSLKMQLPKATKQDQLKMANIFTAGIPILAAHTAGAAVDVMLLNSKGELLDFGVPYDHGNVESVTDYLELSSTAKNNRHILKEGMEKSGFTNYPFEYWHYTIGDVCAAYLTGQKYAQFGPVNFNPKTKRQTQSLGRQELYNFFTI